jgi:hypothetical protein
MSEHITDHAARAQARLLGSVRDLATHRGLIELSTTWTQGVEDAFWVMLNDSVDVATAAQLDVWGRVVGHARDGRTDDVYRAWIKVRFAILRGGGTGDAIVRAFMDLAPECTVTLIEEFPASIRLLLTGVPPAAPLSDLAGILRAAKAGGVRAILEFLVTFGGATFTLDTGPGLDVGKLAYSEAV